MYSIGLDISKSTINVYVPLNDLDLVIENSLKGIKTLYSKLKKHYKKEFDNLVFVYEPTGNYSSILKSFCANKNILCFIINPKQSSNYAKALGNKTKTDKIDAKMLSSAITLANKKDIKVPVINVLYEELQELMIYKSLIIKQKTQFMNHLESKQYNTSTYLVNNLKKKIEVLQKDEEEILEKIKLLLKTDDTLYESFLNLQTIKRVGEKIAIELLLHFIKYPDANKKQIVSLAGLEPIYRESGSSYKTKARISKSESVSCRSALFMAVFSYQQLDLPFIEFYKRLKEKGKSTNVIKVALMRKLLILAHSLYKNNQCYEKAKHVKYDSN
jgi:transposase